MELQKRFTGTRRQRPIQTNLKNNVPHQLAKNNQQMDYFPINELIFPTEIKSNSCEAQKNLVIKYYR